MTETRLDILTLFAGVVLLMIALTLFGEYMRQRAPTSAPRPVVETYLTRVNSWWGMVTLLAFAALAGQFWITLLFAFASFAALREFLTYASKRQADHLSLALAFFAFLPLQYLFVALGWIQMFTVFIPVYAFLLLPIVSALRGDPDKFLARVAGTQWGLMICVFCLSHVPALLTLPMPTGSDRAILMIVFLVMVVQLGDLIEYFAGRQLGEHKLAPSLSPKTAEGVVVAAIGVFVIGALLAWITPFSALGAAIMALMAWGAGWLGNLVFAAIKRDRGVKDWSHLIPGQGGFLEQLDSVIFAAPLFFHVSLLALE